MQSQPLKEIASSQRTLLAMTKILNSNTQAFVKRHHASLSQPVIASVHLAFSYLDVTLNEVKGL